MEAKLSLTDAAWPAERQKAHISIREELARMLDIFVPAKQRRRRPREWKARADLSIRRGLGRLFGPRRGSGLLDKHLAGCGIDLQRLGQFLRHKPRWPANIRFDLTNRIERAVRALSKLFLSDIQIFAALLDEPPKRGTMHSSLRGPVEYIQKYAGLSLRCGAIIE
jgi:hypothetical protein